MTDPAFEPAVASLTDADRLAATGVIRDGRVFDLGLELRSGQSIAPVDRFPPFRLSWSRLPRALWDPEGSTGFEAAMEIISGSLHHGTHVDGLAHIHSHGRLFGGHRTGDVYSDHGWTKHGIETVPPVMARGVLLDVAASEGLDALPDDFEIGPEHLQRCIRRRSLSITPGSVVLIRTGKIAEYKAGSASYFGAQPGVGRRAAIWLADQGMVALGTDTSGTEPQPMPDLERTVHAALLVERGILLFEMLDLDELAAADRPEFLFVALPLKIAGATGSWVRPVAMC